MWVYRQLSKDIKEIICLETGTTVALVAGDEDQELFLIQFNWSTVEAKGRELWIEDAEAIFREAVEALDKKGELLGYSGPVERDKSTACGDSGRCNFPSGALE